MIRKLMIYHSKQDFLQSNFQMKRQNKLKMKSKWKWKCFKNNAKCKNLSQNEQKWAVFN